MKRKRFELKFNRQGGLQLKEEFKGDVSLVLTASFSNFFITGVSEDKEIVEVEKIVREPFKEGALVKVRLKEIRKR